MSGEGHADKFLEQRDSAERSAEGPDGSGGRASRCCLNKGRLCLGAESRLVLLGQEEQGEGESITEPSVKGKKVLRGFKCTEEWGF